MLHLPKLNREVLRRSFQRDLAAAARRYYVSMIMFMILNNVITIGSVLVVSFMSIEKITLVSDSMSEGFFWAAWIISVIVVIASKLVGVFSLQKKFVTDKLVLEKYKSEGWKYVSGIGHYKDKNSFEAFKIFITRIQKIKMNLVESYSVGDSRNIFNSELNLRSSQPIYQGAATANESAMYTESSSLSPDLFSKFEAGDIELQDMDRVHDNVAPATSN